MPETFKTTTKLPYIPASMRTYNILIAYGMSPDAAFNLCREPYPGYFIVGCGYHTPYYESHRACDALCERHPSVDKKFPEHDASSTPRAYRILWDVEKHYRLITGDNFEWDEKAKDHEERHKDHMNYYKRILKYIYQNESQVVKRISGKISKEKIIEEISGQVQINLDGDPLVESVEKKVKVNKHMPAYRPSPEFIQECIEEVAKGNFPEYIPVRECAANFTGQEKTDFLKKIIRLAENHEETAVDRFNTQRAIRVAQNTINDMKSSQQMELF